MGDHSEGRLGLSTTQVAGSALAAVSSAVLLSTLGVAGTVIGAAVGSVAATIGTAVYTRTLDASRQQVSAQAAALRRVSRARSELDEAVAARSRGEAVNGTGIARAGRELDEAQAALVVAEADRRGLQSEDPEDPAGGSGVPPSGPAPGRAGGWRAQLSWRRLAVLAAVVFLVTMTAITAFELATGRAVSTYTGGSTKQTGSTVPGLGRGSGQTTPSPTPSRTDRPTDSATADPTDSSTEGTPDASPGSSPSARVTQEPSEAPTAEPSGTPTDVPPSPTTPPSPTPSPADQSLTPSPSPSTAVG